MKSSRASRATPTFFSRVELHRLGAQEPVFPRRDAGGHAAAQDLVVVGAGEGDLLGVAPRAHLPDDEAGAGEVAGLVAALEEELRSRHVVVALAQHDVALAVHLLALEVVGEPVGQHRLPSCAKLDAAARLHALARALDAVGAQEQRTLVDALAGGACCRARPGGAGAAPARRRAPWPRGRPAARARATSGARAPHPGRRRSRRATRRARRPPHTTAGTSGTGGEASRRPFARIRSHSSLPVVAGRIGAGIRTPGTPATVVAGRSRAARDRACAPSHDRTPRRRRRRAPRRPRRLGRHRDRHARVRLRAGVGGRELPALLPHHPRGGRARASAR